MPAQQSLNLGTDPNGIGPAVKMDDADASDYIVRDIGRMPGLSRWAFLHPELRFRVHQADGLHFTAEIAIQEVTFQATGPVSVAYFIDGRRLGSIHCDRPGKYQIDEPVAADWVQPDQYIHVTFEADHHWVSPGDGSQLSFRLFRAGFR
jgi:hypothetical protein